ncbi:unnamed protein product [Spirodela intermedia]|uniref:Uncharacterized protein n=1 Tax=Spirodela intermedia TaxID=51605 RepID=A0A7I8KQW2_SPIIN|nr:unnamed protein product [Spirodela intermedia]
MGVLEIKVKAFIFLLLANNVRVILLILAF